MVVPLVYSATSFLILMSETHKKAETNDGGHPDSEAPKPDDALYAHRTRFHEGATHIVEDGDFVFVGDEDFGGRRQKKALPGHHHTDTQGRMTHTAIVRTDLRKEADAMNVNLERLAVETPEAVFGKEWNEAFATRKEIESGEIVLHCGCMDERVPDAGGLKLGTAGSGVLMTNLDAEEFKTSDTEAIYAFLSDPRSGDANFSAMVASIKSMLGENGKVKVSDHGGCGAAGICTKLFKDRHGIELDAKRVAKAGAARLHSALGLPGAALHTDYESGDIPMDGDPHTHDAHGLLIDTTGRMRLDGLGKKLRMLKLSGISLLKDADDEVQNGYLQTELSAGTGIIAGDHGVGLENSPILVVLDPSVPNARRIVESRYDLAAQKGRAIYFVESPDPS